METRKGQGLIRFGSAQDRWLVAVRAKRAAYIASQGPDYLPTIDPSEVPSDCPGCGGTRWRRSADGPTAEPCPICCPPKAWRSLSEYVIPPGFPAAARHEMEHAVEVIRLVIDSGGPPWVVLVGPNGSGKTMLASILLAARQKAGDSGQMWRAEELMGWLRETQGDLDHLPLEERATLGSRMAWLRKLKWLMLDELGKERQTPWAIEQMETIINRRYVDESGLIVTSNYDPTALGSPFSDAVRSRFGEGRLCAVIRLTHVPDFRPTLRPGEASRLSGGERP